MPHTSTSGSAFRHARTAAVLGLVTACLSAQMSASAEPVRVRHAEGIVHGFLVLRTLDGATVADGDLIQTSRGSTVTARLIFRFKDGSTHDETAVFSQRQQFRLVSSRLVQKGPSFPRPLDMSIDAVKGTVIVRYADDDGEQKIESEKMELPSDLANGFILTLLKNVRPDAPPKSLSFVAATPKPRLVTLKLSVAGQERFSTGTMARTATHYVVKVDIGGISGLVAPLVGKQPPDSHVWILGGEAPAFVKSEQQLYPGGPIWRIELVSPTWPRAEAAR
jgi:hypothetical protein